MRRPAVRVEAVFLWVAANIYSPLPSAPVFAVNNCFRKVAVSSDFIGVLILFTVCSWLFFGE